MEDLQPFTVSLSASPHQIIPFGVASPFSQSLLSSLWERTWGGFPNFDKKHCNGEKNFHKNITAVWKNELFLKLITMTIAVAVVQSLSCV